MNPLPSDFLDYAPQQPAKPPLSSLRMLAMVAIAFTANTLAVVVAYRFDSGSVVILASITAMLCYGTVIACWTHKRIRYATIGVFVAVLLALILPYASFLLGVRLGFELFGLG
jgi:hypothetical protein